MGKKKPFINKKTASVYHVVRRSQRDVGTEATSETLSDFVLMPSPDNAAKEQAKKQEAQLLEEQRRRLATAGEEKSTSAAAADDDGAGNKAKNSNNKNKIQLDFDTLKSQINAAGLQDTTATTYSQYTKPIENNLSSGSTFIPASNSGYLHEPDAQALSSLFTDTTKNSLDTALQEAMAIHEVGRMLDSIALSADCMEEDIARALFDEDVIFGNDDCDGEYEEILDDFCLTANAEVLDEDDNDGGGGGGGEFNYEQHIQMLMEKARAKENGDEAGGRGLGKDDFFAGVTPLHGRIDEDDEDDDFDYDQYGEEEDEDDDMDSLDREFNGAEDNHECAAASSSSKLGATTATKTMNDEQQRILCQKFQEALLEYDSDDVGDLDDECEDIAGDRPLEGDRQLEAALDEFLTEKEDDILIEGTNKKNRTTEEKKRTGGSGYSALVGKTMVNASDLDTTNNTTNNNTLLINMEESKKQMERDLADADAILANPEMDLPPEEVFIDGQSYFSVKERNPWDCESILSTYSNLDNNPVVIGRSDKKKHRRGKKKSQQQEQNDNVIPEDGPVKIQLSNKTGLPLGVFDNHHHSPEHDDDGYYDNYNNNEESDTYLSINRGEARPKSESKLEKKQRKMAIKEERKVCRIQKKIMKEAFKEEFQKRGHDVVVNDVGGNTVFRF